MNCLFHGLYRFTWFSCTTVKNFIKITELSEVKSEVKMEVNSLRSWKLNWTIPYRLTAFKTVVLPVALA